MPWLEVTSARLATEAKRCDRRTRAFSNWFYHVVKGGWVQGEELLANLRGVLGKIREYWGLLGYNPPLNSPPLTITL